MAVKNALVDNLIHGGGGAPKPPAGDEASPGPCNGLNLLLEVFDVMVELLRGGDDCKR